MRLRYKRQAIAVLLWTLAGCGDPSGTTPDDEAPEYTDANASDEEPSTFADAGRSSRRDAGGADSGAPSDAGEEPTGDMEVMPDGGRRRRDGGVRDATVPRDAAAPEDASAPTATSDAAVPAGDLCAPTASWDPAWAAFEDEVLRLTNEARAAGATCGSKGTFAPVKPLAMEDRLRCAARLYSKEMVDTNNFNHTSTDGTKFDQRIAKTGYRGRQLGENIAAGYATPAAVVAGWMKSEGHCTNIMATGFTQIGIGYYIAAGAQAHWTQDFGTPL